MKIKGVPEGWELVRLGSAKQGEWYMLEDGSVRCAKSDHFHRIEPIIKKTEKPKRYRPFASAEEFKPHRDRWQTRKDRTDDDHQPGACRPVAYNDVGMWFPGTYTTYVDAFKSGRVFDDDGSPFGIEVTE